MRSTSRAVDPGHAVVVALPLSTLLSQALVAFTIEADNVFEQRMPHCTTEGLKAGQPGRGPWLTSLSFWATCLKFVEPSGTPVGDVLDKGFQTDSFLLGTNPGMVRWGYLRLVPGTSGPRRPDRTWTAAPTTPGRQAQETWAPIPGLVEERWAQRWPSVPALRQSLAQVVAAADRDLPDHLPINAGHAGRVTIPVRPALASADDADLAALLAKALLLFTIEVEELSPVPLVHSANVLRVLADEAVAQRDLPKATGAAKETLAVMTGVLQKRGLVSLTDAKVFELTEAGHAAFAAAGAAVASVEAHWPSDLRAHLETLVGPGTVDRSPLAEAIRPPEGCWRHRRPTPKTLPHHPVVSHRGGYPDGA